MVGECTVIKQLTLISSLLILTGCAGFSGLDAKTKHSCKAPDGITCTSVSGIYENALIDNLPGQMVTKPHVGQSSQQQTTQPCQGDHCGQVDVISPAKRENNMLIALSSGDPVLIPPVVLRVWIAPWKDAQGDLHDQQYMYTIVKEGDWKLTSMEQRIKSEFKPVYPLQGKTE